MYKSKFISNLINKQNIFYQAKRMMKPNYLTSKKLPQQNKLNSEPKNQVKPKQKVPWVNPLKDRTRVVPFIVPDLQTRMTALGSMAGQAWRIKKSLKAILQDFQPIKQPQPGDNLYEYQQDGQDFPLFKSIARNHIDIETQTIYVTSFMCKLQKQVIKEIKNKAKAFFHGVKVKLYKFPENIDLTKFGQRVSEDGFKYYDAAKMNTYFKKLLPKGAYSVAIITDMLIYNGDRVEDEIDQLWVFGLGSIRDRTCIISYEQVLCKTFGGQKDQGSESDPFNLEMLSKIVNHELCHTFALKHCIYYSCLMNGSNGYHEASAKEAHLCPICLRKLQSELKFDIFERYQTLGDKKSLQLAQKIKKSLGLSK